MGDSAVGALPANARAPDVRTSPAEARPAPANARLVKRCLIMSRPLQPLNPRRPYARSAVSGKLVDGFAFTDAPDVGDADIAFALADADVAPAFAALLDAADNARLGVIANAALAFGLRLDRARLALLDD